MKKIVLYIVLALSISFNVCGMIPKNKTEEIKPATDTLFIKDTLSDWEIFTLALMKVESEYNKDAVSSAGAKGYFQMTPVYVKEVNRIHKTNYEFSQVTDFYDAYEIFNLMQKAHNPEYDIDKALVLHNGNRKWYRKRVYDEMKRIRIYEDMRDKVKSI